MKQVALSGLEQEAGRQEQLKKQRLLAKKQKRKKARKVKMGKPRVEQPELVKGKWMFLGHRGIFDIYIKGEAILFTDCETSSTVIGAGDTEALEIALKQLDKETMEQSEQ